MNDGDDDKGMTVDRQRCHGDGRQEAAKRDSAWHSLAQTSLAFVTSFLRVSLQTTDSSRSSLQLLRAPSNDFNNYLIVVSAPVA